MKKVFFIVTGFVLLLLSGCYYDKEDLLYGGNCDTTNTKYSTTITSMLNNYGCLGCHVGGNPGGGINLENYPGVKAVADNGKLYGAISHASGFIPMPDGAAKISSCDLNKVKAWIDSGAPNN